MGKNTHQWCKPKVTSLPECKQRRSEMLVLKARVKEHKKMLREGAECRADQPIKAVGTLCVICLEVMDSEADRAKEAAATKDVIRARMETTSN